MVTFPLSTQIAVFTAAKRSAMTVGRFAILLLVLWPALAQDQFGGYRNNCNDPPARIEPADIGNFHKVDADAYRGARPRRSDEVYKKLVDLGIRTVINLEGSGEAAKEKAEVDHVNQKLLQDNRPPLDFISFPINSISRTVLFATPDQRIHSLFEQMQNSKKPIFIHCHQGKDRTGAIIMLYRIKRKQFKESSEAQAFKDAFREAKYYEFSRFNFGLKRTVNRYKDQGKLGNLPDPNPSPTRPEDVCIGNALKPH